MAMDRLRARRGAPARQQDRRQNPAPAAAGARSPGGAAAGRGQPARHCRRQTRPPARQPREAVARDQKDGRPRRCAAARSAARVREHRGIERHGPADHRQDARTHAAADHAELRARGQRPRESRRREGGRHDRRGNGGRPRDRRGGAAAARTIGSHRGGDRVCSPNARLPYALPRRRPWARQWEAQVTNNRKPNWGFWRHAGPLTLPEAVGLSLGIDPDKLRRAAGATLPVINYPEVRIYRAEPRVRLDEFLAWAQAVGWELPPALSPRQEAQSTPPPSGIRTTRQMRAEAACAEYLRNLTPAPANKEAAFAAAKRAVADIGPLSRKAFERAWANAALAAWRFPGRRGK